MRVFICWSGPTSKAVAQHVRDWLKKVIQATEPFISEEIEKGEPWMTRLTEELAHTDFAIICLTPDNLTSPWLHFETAAVWKGLDQSRVVPYLHLVDKADLKYPLAHFQSAVSTKKDTLALLQAVNSHLEHPIGAEDLREQFDMWWPTLETALSEVKPSAKKSPTSPARTPDEIQREILLAVRELAQRMERIERSRQEPGQLLPMLRRRDSPVESAIVIEVIEELHPQGGTSMDVMLHDEGTGAALNCFVPTEVYAEYGTLEPRSRIRYSGTSGHGDYDMVLSRYKAL